MGSKLLVFDSHPVQYRVPIWKGLAHTSEITVHVAYATDCSVKGYADKEFGQNISWDDPMLEGYDFSILNSEKGKPLEGWNSLTGKGVRSKIKEIKPDAILLTGLNYRYDLVCYLFALINQIPLWLRCETQDFASERSKGKSFIRSIIYRIVYRGFDRFLYIGELNKKHYLRHGVSECKLVPSRYGTLDRLCGFNDAEKLTIRNESRRKAGIKASDFVVGFSGKFISKKNPDILFRMLDDLPQELRKRLVIYLIGSGDLEPELKKLAYEANIKYDINTFFTGFVNQSAISLHYLAIDILVLPSRRMGETWGLVTNEGMQAGCSIIVSDSVGSSADFKAIDRFRVFKTGNSNDLANQITQLSNHSLDFDWAKQVLANYSVEANVNAIYGLLLKDTNI